MTTTADIPPDWIAWIGENQLLGITESQILDVLVAKGFDRRVAEQQVACATLSPYLKSAEIIAQKLRKLESMMEIYSELWSRSRALPGVDRVSRITPHSFFHWYYSVNRPVVLLDQMSNWAALKRWTPEYFKDRCGGEMVEVMIGRNSDAAYEINSDRHKTTMRLDNYVDLVRAGGETNDFYMVANNRSIEAGNMRLLLDDIEYFEGILNPEDTVARMFLWFGPGGTVTPLHYDTMNVLLAQVLGRKKVTLIPSFQTHLVYNNVGVYSEVDCEAPDYVQYPLFRNVTRHDFVLEPGQALFIPVGWWHHVRSLDVSMSVSFTNFQVSNSYRWHKEE